MASARREMEIESNDRSRQGTVFTSFSFANEPVTLLTGSGYDPETQTAELKGCPVRITPL